MSDNNTSPCYHCDIAQYGYMSCDDVKCEYNRQLKEAEETTERSED